MPSQTLLRLLVQTFAPTGTLVFGGDETIERRRGSRTKAKGIYRDSERARIAGDGSIRDRQT